MKVNFVTFYTEGPPRDSGQDFRHLREPTRLLVEKEFDEVVFYTPQKVSESLSEKYVREVPCSGAWGNIGNQEWKPAIILQELRRLSDNDILVYHDINYQKHPAYKQFQNFRILCQKWLDWCEFDFFIPMSILPTCYQINGGDPLKRWCKEHSLRQLSKDYEFSANFLQCVVNLLVLKKNKVSMDFISEWLYHCSKEEYLNKLHYGFEKGPWLIKHLPEQSVANIILCNWILEGKHNIPKNYPSFGFTDRNIQKPFFSNAKP